MARLTRGGYQDRVEELRRRRGGRGPNARTDVDHEATIGKALVKRARRRERNLELLRR